LAIGRIAGARSLWTTLRARWQNHASRNDVPDLVRVGQDRTPQGPMIMTAVLGGRPYRR
jgi:hypothetical protein